MVKTNKTNKQTSTQVKVNLLQQLINNINSGSEFTFEVFTPFNSSTHDEVTNNEVVCEISYDEYENGAGYTIPGVNIVFNEFYVLTTGITNGFKISVSSDGTEYTITYKQCTISFTF